MGMAAMAATMTAATGSIETRFVAGRETVMGMRACLAKALIGDHYAGGFRIATPA
ncbi:hypothetical protein [Rhizobium rhizogenes]|jgi:hypothetical protein|uniref:hypothetical protein n=1 Tax=Rhizobium rhizogenes TaxID=359 RepID=UPI002869A8F2|nr:hypothetical protein [Rhizobium rhizogenes]